MVNNDVLRSVRYMLDINDGKIAKIIKLGGYMIGEGEVKAFLKKNGEEGYQTCPDEVMAPFLDGLICFKRGTEHSRATRTITLPVTNNMVLKKIRVAFQLKEEDLHTILNAANFPMSKPELSALFRKAGHANYRICGDQLLRNFLKGLTARVRQEATVSVAPKALLNRP